MPMFYTRRRSGTHVAEDKAGQEFDDLEGARRAARQAGRTTASDEIFMGADAVDVELTIEDEAGKRQATIEVIAQVRCSEPAGDVPTTKSPILAGQP